MQTGKVIIVAPGPLAKGGIVKVISYYKENQQFWDENILCWVSSFSSRGHIYKIIDLLNAIIIFLTKLNKVSIIHLHFTTGNSANRKYIFFLLSRTFNKKIISHIHTPSLNFLNEANFAFKRMIVDSDRVIVLSEIWQNKLMEYHKRHYDILHNPSKRFSKNTTKEKIILFAGRLEKRKGCWDLLEAFNLIEKKDEYQLILAGNGEVERANKIIRDNNIPNVKVVGWQNELQIMEWFKKALIFILPSYAEGFPISVIDSLSSSCATITTRVGGIPDLLEGDKHCIYISPGNIIEIKNALNLLIRDDAVRLKLSVNGFKLARAEFDCLKITNKLIEIYKEVL